MSQSSDYRKLIPGSDLHAPFRVTEGLVVVHLARHRSIVIPAGGDWPGLEQLRVALAAYLNPERSSCFPGTSMEPGDDTGRKAAVALVLGQALTALGSLSERMKLAPTSASPSRRSTSDQRDWRLDAPESPSRESQVPKQLPTLYFPTFSRSSHPSASPVTGASSVQTKVKEHRAMVCYRYTKVVQIPSG